MLLNVAYYAIDPPLLFHVMLHCIKHYNISLLLYWSIKDDSTSIECFCTRTMLGGARALVRLLFTLLQIVTSCPYVLTISLPIVLA